MNETHPAPGWGSYVAALLVPIVGFVLATIALSRGYNRQGVGLILVSSVGMAVWVAAVSGGEEATYY